MPKAAATVQSVMAQGSALHVAYTVAVDTGLNFSGDAIINTNQTVAQLLTAARQKVVNDCASKGVTLALSDVAIFGGPA